MNCLSQKANSTDYRDNYDRIFDKKPEFDYVKYINESLGEEDEEDKVEMRFCKICGQPQGGMLLDEWENKWNQVCDDCVTAIQKGEIV